VTSQYTPTLAGFQAWANVAMGVTSTILPLNNPAWNWAFTVAINLVDPLWCQVSPPIYQLMVYLVSASNLLNWAQDPVGAPIYKNNMTYFEYWRDKWNLLGPVSGVVSAASDQGSATSLEVPEALKNLTLLDLQHLKDPYGRQYTALAQSQGDLWGLS
jgi:hypothetical protein